MKIRNIGAGKATVLVGVLKRKRDLDIFLKEHWYRIPLLKVPKRKFRYLALYEPARFGRRSKCIRYYARVARCLVEKRRELLPDEREHPNAEERYLRIRVGRVTRLPRPIRNVPPRRLSFGFADLDRLLAVKTILQLYHVAPTEEIVGAALKRSHIRAIPQCHVSCAGKHYCLDFAVHCERGSIAVECDNKKAHAGARQQAYDSAKDTFLFNHGWTVIRLKEEAILSDVQSCVLRIRRAIKNFGGMACR